MQHTYTTESVLVPKLTVTTTGAIITAFYSTRSAVAAKVGSPRAMSLGSL